MSGLSAQLLELRRKYEQQYLTDPVFHARCKLTENVLGELESAGALKGNKSFAAFVLVAQEKLLHPREEIA